MGTRRDWMRGVAASAMAPAMIRAGLLDEGADGPALIARGTSPLNAEPPVELLNDYLTPLDRFFIRSHFGAPGESGSGSVAIGGLVKSPGRLSPAQVRELEHVTLPAVLQCSGNGRSMFSPTVPGVGWERGAVGNAEWTGVRLKDILDRAGLDPKAKHVIFRGSDGPPNPKTPAFRRSLPIERALDPSTLVAYRMNGQPVPRLHGGPLRLIVPGWSGNHWIKWLSEITASEEEAPGFYQRTGYRMPKQPVPPGVDVKPEDTVPVTVLNVKSLITAPARGDVRKPGKVTIAGAAWTGLGRVKTVEVSIDGGDWREAKLVGPDHPYAWRRWEFAWDATSGPHKVRARATDSEGAVQPERPAWNKSGYLWNGIDEVAFEVRES